MLDIRANSLSSFWTHIGISKIHSHGCHRDLGKSSQSGGIMASWENTQGRPTCRPMVSHCHFPREDYPKRDCIPRKPKISKSLGS